MYGIENENQQIPNRNGFNYKNWNRTDNLGWETSKKLLGISTPIHIYIMILVISVYAAFTIKFEAKDFIVTFYIYVLNARIYSYSTFDQYNVLSNSISTHMNIQSKSGYKTTATEGRDIKDEGHWTFILYKSKDFWFDDWQLAQKWTATGAAYNASVT